MTNSKTYKSKVGTKQRVIKVLTPSLEQRRQGQKEYNKAFSDAVQSGALLRLKLNDFMKEQGIWNDKKEAEVTSLAKEIINNEKALARGGIRLTEARLLALKIKECRYTARCSTF